MKSTARRRLVLTLALAALMPLMGPAATMQKAARKAIQLEDIINWKAIGATTVSNDGQWFAYRLAPGEGDAQIVIRATRSDKELKFDIGDPSGGNAGAPAGPGPGGPGAVAGSTLEFSADSKWAAFTTYPKRAEAQRLRRQRRPVQNSVTIVNLATGSKTETPKIRRFAFSGDAATWIALHRAPAQPTPGGGAGAAAAPGGGGRGGGAGAPAPADHPIGRAVPISFFVSSRRDRN